MSLLQILRFARNTDRLGKAMRWRPERVAAAQRKRLRKLLRHAVKHSQFYRDKFAGIDVERADLAQLPIATKEEIRENFNLAVTDPEVTRRRVEHFIADENNLGKWFLGKYAVSHTSGSQGAPLLIVQDRRAIEIMFSMMSARASTAARPGIVEGIRRLLHPKRIAIVTFRRGFYPSGASLEYMEEIMGPFVRVLRLSSMQRDLVAQLRAFQPNVLVGFASVLDALATRAGEMQLRELWQVTNTSEQLLETARKRIQSAFGAPVCDHYGIGECLHLSDSCAAERRIHINSDWAILETVDERNRPVEPGTMGAKVLVTNLANFAQPFIRYEVSDHVALAAEPCPCGNRLPVIAQMNGRSSDVFWVGSGSDKQLLPGILFHQAVDATHAVREWQAIQTGEREIDLLLEPLAAGDRSTAAVRAEALANLIVGGLPIGVRVNIRFVSRLDANAATGKMQRMIVNLSDASQQMPRLDLEKGDIQLFPRSAIVAKNGV